MSKYSGGFFI